MFAEHLVQPYSFGHSLQSSLCLKIKLLNLVACPRCSSQKFQARTHGRVVLKTIDVDSLRQTVPIVMINQELQNIEQLNSMQGVVGLILWRNSFYFHSLVEIEYCIYWAKVLPFILYMV